MAFSLAHTFCWYFFCDFLQNKRGLFKTMLRLLVVHNLKIKCLLVFHAC